MRLFFRRIEGGCLSASLTVALLFLSTVTLRAQDERVEFSELNVTIEKAFTEIERQTEYLISFDYTDFDVSRKVRLRRGSHPVKSVMGRLLSGTNRSWIVRGNHILVVPRDAPEEVVATIAEPADTIQPEPEPEPLPEIDLTRPPVDVDSLERAIRARASEFASMNVPPKPKLDPLAYERERQSQGLGVTGQPAYLASMPKFALRTNLLYWASLTPNLGVEFGVSPHSTVLLNGSINPWEAKNPDTDNKMLKHWTASAEYRYWFCERFNGHFLGVHGYYSYYNISGYKIPMIFEKGSEDHRYKGYAAGAGISYGYQLMLGKNWNLEFNAGIGFGYMKYDRRECPRCEYTEILQDQTRTFFAPTKLGISIVYVIK